MKIMKLFVFVFLLNNFLSDVRAQDVISLLNVGDEPVAVTDGEEMGNEPVAVTDGEEMGDVDGFVSDMPSDMPSDMSSIASTKMPTGTPTGPEPVVKSTCYETTKEMFDVSQDDRLLFKPKKFILCPNTVYNLGIFRFNATFAGILEGDHPLVPRMNTIIQCGESGASSNNCTLVGGDWGILTAPLLNSLEYETSNILIKGITFKSQFTYGLFFGLPGTNVVLDDCIIKDQSNQGAVVFNNRGPWSFRRHLERYEKYDDPLTRAYLYMKDIEDGFFDDEIAEHRELNEIDPLEVIVQNSVFENCSQAEAGSNLEFGVVTFRIDTHNVTFQNNLFIDNDFGDQMIGSIGYGILSTGSELHLFDNCFVDNAFFGAGLAIMSPGSTFSYSGNYASCPILPDLTCPFIVSFDSIEAEEANEYTCHNTSAEATCSSYLDIVQDRCSIPTEEPIPMEESENEGPDDVDKEVTEEVTDEVATNGEKDTSGGSISGVSSYLLLSSILLLVKTMV